MPPLGSVVYNFTFANAFVLGCAAPPAALCGLLFRRTRKRATQSCAVMLCMVLVRLPKSNAIWRLVQWLKPCAFFADCALRGHLGTIEKGRSLFCLHPHGIQTVGGFMNMFWNPELNALAGTVRYFADVVMAERQPFVKVILSLRGQCIGITPTNLKRCMSAGENISIHPGGFAEASLMRSGEQAVVVRTQLMRVLLRYALRLHPMYTFGETDTFSTVVAPEKWRLKLNN
eukprot:NODE_10840_length_1325_cov_4.050083.p1 GENE.NODE_10840_length_1325_cov_4.050083~~NODE_10840_length_1325_cov_4.050083.p1  ORF type:complete len:230 (-),score=39.13 NODE_10840_length_1325_cov_4.050083:565-1254(-)